jgi:hypothetical protein
MGWRRVDGRSAASRFRACWSVGDASGWSAWLTDLIGSWLNPRVSFAERGTDDTLWTLGLNPDNRIGSDRMGTFFAAKPPRLHGRLRRADRSRAGRSSRLAPKPGSYLQERLSEPRSELRASSREPEGAGLHLLRPRVNHFAGKASRSHRARREPLCGQSTQKPSSSAYCASCALRRGSRREPEGAGGSRFAPSAPSGEPLCGQSTQKPSSSAYCASCALPRGRRVRRCNRDRAAHDFIEGELRASSKEGATGMEPGATSQKASCGARPCNFHLEVCPIFGAGTNGPRANDLRGEAAHGVLGVWRQETSDPIDRI